MFKNKSAQAVPRTRPCTPGSVRSPLSFRGPRTFWTFWLACALLLLLTALLSAVQGGSLWSPNSRRDFLFFLPLSFYIEQSCFSAESSVRDCSVLSTEILLKDPRQGMWGPPLPPRPRRPASRPHRAPLEHLPKRIKICLWDEASWAWHVCSPEPCRRTRPRGPLTGLAVAGSQDVVP